MSSLCAEVYCELMDHERILSSGSDRTMRNDPGRSTATGFRSDARPQITVISTTTEGTLAAFEDCRASCEKSGHADHAGNH